MAHKKILSVLVLTAALAFPLGNNANAAQTSGSTSVSVTLPDIIILHYISGITLNFTTEITEGINEATTSWTVAWDGTPSEGTLELANGASSNLSNAVTELDGNPITVNIPNVWAIRGFSSDGTATVAIKLDDARLDSEATGSSAYITMSNPQVDDNDGHVGATITAAPLNGIKKSTATVGNVNLTFDLQNAVESATYSGGQYTITATAV